MLECVESTELLILKEKFVKWQSSELGVEVSLVCILMLDAQLKEDSYREVHTTFLWIMFLPDDADLNLVNPILLYNRCDCWTKGSCTFCS